MRLAQDADYSPRGDREAPEEVLSKIDEYERAKPPAAQVPGLDRALIDPYSDSADESEARILAALPRFAEVGRAIFGNPPPVRFFLFAEEPASLSFSQALSFKPVEKSHTTGVVNMVHICAARIRRKDEDDVVALALHETTHAWLASYLRAKYDRSVRLPTYIDEGLAGYVSTLAAPPQRVAEREKRVMEERRERVREWLAQHPGPTEFDELVSYRDFHSDRNSLNYAMAALLAARMLGPVEAGAPKIPALLDALALSRDHEAAWRRITGKDVREEYRALAAEL